jgi:hypothetical protein
VHVDELAARMRETERQPDLAGLGALGQHLIGAISVDLHHAGEAVAELRDDRRIDERKKRAVPTLLPLYTNDGHTPLLLLTVLIS